MILEHRQALANILATTQNDPYLFVKLAFPWGKDSLTGKDILDWQADILKTIRDELIEPDKAIRIAVASGHGIGKSTLVAWLILWAISTKFNTKGRITANTESQIMQTTWAELQKWYNMSIVKDLFTWTATALFSNEKEYNKSWSINAIAWSVNNPEAFAGLHNQGSRLIVIFDEASGIDRSIWEVVEGAMTDKDTQIIWAVFGNPTRPDGAFFDCFNRHRKRWITRKIDSRTVSITNKTELDEWIALHGIDSDFVKIRILGEFPSKANDSLISALVVDEAIERTVSHEVYKNAPKILGVDVARFGDDQTVIAYRQGYKLHKLDKYSQLDTIEVVDKVTTAIHNFEPDAVFIDVGGVGAGVYDNLIHSGYQNVYAVEFGSKATEPNKYYNKRSEIWCKMAEWLELADIPDDIALKDDLCLPQYSYKSDSGVIALERKQDMKKRGLASPDSADAIAVTFARNIYKQGRKLPSRELR